ncbi:uncharacterized protein LAESUDRAFT_645761 [Laetiporus sulphureus 93-53]|uniref:ATP-dependent DNA helicase n=1 Tax=Laetiporus sulphureus 93-53 TaxID=1314785 RepID=A0A165G8C3_9APHY|nr:uncharacterized protein LAESUDRAFT_645761 [Laetiporus sulphureus 93-53]KZT09969.1 hypothetical protein LAESUDRAFT_645761 [Laetiporus sulphureus 93-53]
MRSAVKNEGKPFRGINMIFSGDFAQLSPAGSGHSLFSHKVRSVLHITSSHYEQESSIGKSLWHQFTTAVILRENMRQKQQTPDNAKIRKALGNLRYKSCTQADIQHLKGYIAGHAADRPKLNQPRFRNVSFITPWNAYRDKINDLGCTCFVREIGQQLITFYSEDKKAKHATVNPQRSSNVIDPETQRVLWNLPHDCTDNHPRKLTLCIGMPVMIKSNEATECCVTNGAEGVVAGWKARPLEDNKLALDTLFVQLTSAPTPIKLEGLPENVVPISHQLMKIACIMPNDRTVSIVRDQVAVILNFAMTDFTSQGRTRPDNVCDLQNCKSHQSIYTCLSKGSTYQGTLIVQGFDERKLMRGISGSLRQEFRDLELLDEITNLRYNKKLPDIVKGVTRNALIVSYRAWRGTMHKALKWSNEDPYPLDDPEPDSPWQMLGKPSKHVDDAQKASVAQKKLMKIKPVYRYVPEKGIKTLSMVSNDQDGKKR